MSNSKDWDKPSIEKLSSLINDGLTNGQIGKFYGVSSSAVSRLIKKYGIKIPRKQHGTQIKNMSGLKFGRLTVIDRTENTVQGQAQWNCICECGKIIKARGFCLRSGHTKSCGCLSVDVSTKLNTSHGMSNTKEYSTWQSIKYRCYNEKSEYYEIYGGRGIVVCDRWLESFKNFYEDMGDAPTEDHQIDRINTNGNYEPDNCRWVTSQQNSQNRRNKSNSLSKYKGVYKSGNKWVANITIDGVQRIIGTYDTEKEAGVRYNEEAIKLFGEFAMLNEIGDGYEN